MAQPIVIAYHLIWTAYGWWLPNDPRGSSSSTISTDVLAMLGELHEGRKTVQPASSDIRKFYAAAQTFLKHELRTFDQSGREILAESFAEVIAEQKYTCYACAIMPDHVHLVIRKHRDVAEVMIEKLQSASAGRLCEAASGWGRDHPVWGGPGWKVFLDHPDEVERTIGYVQRNPDPLGMPRQHWPFVAAYDRWPLHRGHSPNSPYVKRLRAAGRYP